MQKRVSEMENFEFALAWREEQEKLRSYAAGVPQNGTIVEIGTGLGGTAKLFRAATRNKNISIFTVDIAPFRLTYKNLQNEDVVIVPRPSAEFARVWKEEAKRPIDLLYIDGDHQFCSVYEDFILWAPHVRPGGMVVFHDYDAPERGGVVHLGVRVCLDTVGRLKLLTHMQHDYKLLSGVLLNPATIRLPVRDCYQTFVDIAENAKRIRQEIFDGSLQKGLQEIQKRPKWLDSLTACYCVDYSLKRGYEALASVALSFPEFLKASEMLSIMEHAYGRSGYPDLIPPMANPEDFIELSRFIAREQMKLSILSMILKSLVEWSV